MPLVAKGLGKLIEECAELSTVAAKKLNYMDIDVHPDGKGSLKERLEDEIADVMAAVNIVTENFDLNQIKIHNRLQEKKILFRQFQDEK